MSAAEKVSTSVRLCPKLDSVLAELAALEEAAIEAMRRVADARIAAGAAGTSFAEREVTHLRVANDLCRKNIERDLGEIVASHGDVLLVDGVVHKKHEDGAVAYHSLCGSMKISRPTYRVVGKHNGPTVVPLDLQAGIMHHATPALAFAIASGYANCPDRECEEHLKAAQRQPPSRSTIERIAKAIGAEAQTAAHRIEVMLRVDEKLPADACAISVGLDRTTVPMEEPRAEDAPRPTGRKERRKPYVRAVPPRIDVNYRMAYVGTVSVVDAGSESIIARRYVAPAEEGPDEILTRMMADVRRAREEKPRMPIGITQDGAPEMWNLTRTALKDHVGISASHEAIDRYHFNERKAEILRIVEPDPVQRKREDNRWRKAFDTDDNAIDNFARWLNQKMLEHEDDKNNNSDNFEKLEDHWTFIVNNSDRLRYASLREAGLPQGSGITEGACKSLVTVRAKRSGQRWHNDGIGAVLALRSIKMSQRLPMFWPQFSADYTAEVRTAA